MVMLEQVVLVALVMALLSFSLVMLGLARRLLVDGGVVSKVVKERAKDYSVEQKRKNERAKVGEVKV